VDEQEVDVGGFVSVPGSEWLLEDELGNLVA
jgi:hypothetical protein